MVHLVADGSAVLIPVKVVPGASRDALVGALGGRLKVRVAAPPEGGRANAALVALLAERLGLRRTALSVIVGAASPEKVIRAEGIEAQEAARRLGLEARGAAGR